MDTALLYAQCPQKLQKLRNFKRSFLPKNFIYLILLALQVKRNSSSVYNYCGIGVSHIIHCGTGVPLYRRKIIEIKTIEYKK